MLGATFGGQGRVWVRWGGHPARRGVLGVPTSPHHLLPPQPRGSRRDAALQPEPPLQRGPQSAFAQSCLRRFHLQLLPEGQVGASPPAGGKCPLGATGHGQDLGNKQKKLLGEVPSPLCSGDTVTVGRGMNPLEMLPVRVQCRKTPFERFSSLVNEAKPRFPAALDLVNPPRDKIGVRGNIGRLVSPRRVPEPGVTAAPGCARRVGGGLASCQTNKTCLAPPGTLS